MSYIRSSYPDFSGVNESLGNLMVQLPMYKQQMAQRRQQMQQAQQLLPYRQQALGAQAQRYGAAGELDLARAMQLNEEAVRTRRADNLMIEGLRDKDPTKLGQGLLTSVQYKNPGQISQSLIQMAAYFDQMSKGGLNQGMRDKLILGDTKARDTIPANATSISPSGDATLGVLRTAPGDTITNPKTGANLATGQEKSVTGSIAGFAGVLNALNKKAEVEELSPDEKVLQSNLVKRLSFLMSGEQGPKVPVPVETPVAPDMSGAFRAGDSYAPRDYQVEPNTVAGRLAAEPRRTMTSEYMGSIRPVQILDPSKYTSSEAPNFIATDAVPRQVVPPRTVASSVAFPVPVSRPGDAPIPDYTFPKTVPNATPSAPNLPSTWEEILTLPPGSLYINPDTNQIEQIPNIPQPTTRRAASGADMDLPPKRWRWDPRVGLIEQ